MLNIELQCCGLVMLMTLLIMMLREKSLDLSSRRLFMIALISAVITETLDIVSIIGIDRAVNGDLPAICARFICKCYVVGLAVQSYEGFLYAAGEFFAVGSHKRIRRLYLIWLIIGVAAIVLLPIRYYMNGREVYSYGPSAMATYVTVLPLILSTMAMAFVGVDHSSKRRRRAILLWMASWLIAAIIQFTFPELLLVGFAGAVGMFLIYAELENPHEGIDRMTGQFTSNALSHYVGDRYQHGLHFASIHIRIEYLIQSVDLETEKTVMLRAANYLRLSRGAYVFRKEDNEFVLIYKDRGRMEEDYLRLEQGLDSAIDMPVRVNYILMPDDTVVASADEFFRIHHYLSFEADTMNEVRIDPEMVDGMREYNRVKEMIQTALDDHRVEVFYQPFYEVAQERFTSAEALVRIRDLDGELVPPGVFIPIAEENGLIVPLGIEIFRQVCAMMATGEPQALGLKCAEVNLSVAQFDKENPADFVQKIMDEYQIDPKWINLEITETASSSAKQILLKNMYKLILNGVHFSLDDFGTGRSNLDYFVDMPVDVIKFDYSFTHGYFKSVKAKYVMESMIELMHRMGLAIVTEGVETKEQFDAMCGLGVEFIQGYYFSKPLPREEFLEFLREKNGGA